MLGAFAVPADCQTPVSSPDGRRQISAVPANGAIIIDGVLDEEVWLKAVPATGFIQADPHEGQPASDVTEVKVAFDTDNLYVAVLCRDADPSGIVVNEIRKDFAGRDQDTFDVLLDTFGDRRNGFVFSTNAAGAKSDTQIANEGRDVNTNWDAVWWVESRRTPEGWTAEFRIPFKTLRFETGEGRSWGINFARRVRKKNEISYWSPVSRAYSIFRASAAGDLTGLPALRRGRNLRLKPFLVGGALRGVGEADFGGDLSGGVDVKAGLTRRSRSTRPSILTLHRRKPTNSKSTSRNSACSSRRSASSFSSTPASSISVTFPGTSARLRAFVRRRKTCCSSSAAASG